jgi:hypothetical protein
MQSKLLFLICLADAPDIKCGKGKLEGDNGERLSMPSPYNPQDVAEEGKQESSVAHAVGLKCQQPYREYIDQHCRPLQQRQVIHENIAPLVIEEPGWKLKKPNSG